MIRPSKLGKNNSERPSQDYQGKDKDGRRIATPADIYQSGFNSNRESVEPLLPAIGSRWQFVGKTGNGLADFSGVAAVRTNQLMKDELVRPTPYDLPMVFEIGNVCPSSRMERGLELVSITVNLVAFQITEPALNDKLEVIFQLGSRSIPLERLMEDFQCENTSIQSTFMEAAKADRATRLDFERKLKALPPPVSSEDKISAGIASGIAIALKNLGVAVPANKSTL
jgi:hypothetical protein